VSRPAARFAAERNPKPDTPLTRIARFNDGRDDEA
jgi:hypothetical protein